MKPLILCLLLILVMPMAGCVVYPVHPVGAVWVPGHYGPYGGWIRGHYT